MLIKNYTQYMNSGFDGTNLSCPVIMEQQQQELHIISNMVVAESFLRSYPSILL